MKVIELIHEFTKEELFNRLLELRPYIYDEWLTNEEKEGIRKGFYFAYDDFNKVSLLDDNKENVIVVCKETPYHKGDSEDYEVSSFNVSETKTGPYEFDGEECISCRYDVCFSPWEDTLNREVCDRSIDLYGKLDCASLIFHELVRMGFSNEYRTKKIEEEIAILTERVDNLKEEECIPADEFFDQLYREEFNETEEQRLERHARQEKEREDNRPYMEWAITQTQNELFKFKKFISENF